MKDIGFSYVSIYNGSRMEDIPSHHPSGSHEERFLAAFEEYSDALFRHAALRLSDRERAIDIVHDTYTKAWMYVREGRVIEHFRPFLYKVLNNLIIDEYRKQRELSLDALLEDEGAPRGAIGDLAEHSAETLVAELDGKRAFTLLSEIPDAYREVITLRFVDGLGPKEISELIEETENVVSVRIHRGLKMLRELIEQEEQSREEQRRLRSTTRTRP